MLLVFFISDRAGREAIYAAMAEARWAAPSPHLRAIRLSGKSRIVLLLVLSSAFPLLPAHHKFPHAR